MCDHICPYGTGLLNNLKAKKKVILELKTLCASLWLPWKISLCKCNFESLVKKLKKCLKQSLPSLSVTGSIVNSSYNNLRLKYIIVKQPESECGHKSIFVCVYLPRKISDKTTWDVWGKIFHSYLILYDPIIIDEFILNFGHNSVWVNPYHSICIFDNWEICHGIFLSMRKFMVRLFLTVLF